MQRRHFLSLPLIAALGTAGTTAGAATAGSAHEGGVSVNNDDQTSRGVKLFLCGDVMTGRGIDQILPYRSSPELYEPYMSSAEHYVRIAERASGRIPQPAGYDYIWGDVLQALDEAAPDVRIVNLETAVTTSNDYWPGKGINYRMHPGNVPVLNAAGIDGCALANNHVIDWGYEGLRETLSQLHRAGIRTSGAGINLAAAMAPALLEYSEGQRVLVFSMGSAGSGIGHAWAAGKHKPGVWLLRDLSGNELDSIARQVASVRRRGDIVVASIHWGGNWGYAIPAEQRHFAHALIDAAGVDLVHGHSSHHPRGLEVYKDKLILYGCGDFINDYEGIRGYEEFRGDLAVMYLPVLDPYSGTLRDLSMQVMQIHRFSLQRASQGDQRWLADTLDRESRKLGSSVEYTENCLRLRRA